MSFWNMSDGESATSTGNEFDAGGGNMDPIPEGTSVLAMPDDVKWATTNDHAEYLSIRWTVLKPDAYLNRKVFHKLFVTDDKPKHKDPVKYRDKALKMLAAIDANAGGKLAKIQGKPSDDQLAVALTNRQMVIRLGLWELEGDNGPISGNWVQSVSGKDKPITEVAKPVAAKAKAQPAYDDDLDDDVPF